MGLIKAALGAAGGVLADQWKTHVYQWSIESGEYATLVFEVTDYSIGIEKLQSVETSLGLLDG